MEILKLLTVFGLGAVELWAAIPAGVALGLHPVITGVVAAIGAMTGVFVVLIVGESLRAWLVQHHGGHSKSGRQGRIYRIWTRYGIVGLGLLAPLLVGAPVGTALAIAFGAPRSRVLVWMSIGIVVWTAGLTFASMLGLVGIEALTH